MLTVVWNFKICTKLRWCFKSNAIQVRNDIMDKNNTEIIITLKAFSRLFANVVLLYTKGGRDWGILTPSPIPHDISVKLIPKSPHIEQTNFCTTTLISYFCFIFPSVSIFVESVNFAQFVGYCICFFRCCKINNICYFLLLDFNSHQRASSHWIREKPSGEGNSTQPKKSISIPGVFANILCERFFPLLKAV